MSTVQAAADRWQSLVAPDQGQRRKEGGLVGHKSDQYPEKGSQTHHCQSPETTR